MTIYTKWSDVPTEERPFFKITTFTPDTCDCRIQYAWDTRLSEDERVHIPFDTLDACEHHEHLRDSKEHEALHENVHGDNQLKNRAIVRILDELPDEQKDFFDDGEGGTVPWFKKEPSWAFNEDRELEITVYDVPTEDKPDIASALETHFAQPEFETSDCVPGIASVTPLAGRVITIK